MPEIRPSPSTARRRRAGSGSWTSCWKRSAWEGSPTRLSASSTFNPSSLRRFASYISRNAGPASTTWRTPIACRARWRTASDVSDSSGTSARPSCAVPIFPIAVAAAPRTPGSGSCSAAVRLLSAAVPLRMPSARAASSRMSLSSSRSACARPWITEASAAWGAIEERSNSSEKRSRKRLTAEARSRSEYISTSVPMASSRMDASPSRSDVTRAGTAAGSRNCRSALTTSIRTFASGSCTRGARCATASRRRLLPSDSAASWRVLALGLFRFARRSSKLSRPAAPRDGAARNKRRAAARRKPSFIPPPGIWRKTADPFGS